LFGVVPGAAAAAPRVRRPDLMRNRPARPLRFGGRGLGDAYTLHSRHALIYRPVGFANGNARAYARHERPPSK
jgi:hypothetical protein